MNGRLIGINTAIYSKSGGSIGIGFAVPSNMVHSVVAGFSGGGRLRAAVDRRLGSAGDQRRRAGAGSAATRRRADRGGRRWRTGREGGHPHRRCGAGGERPAGRRSAGARLPHRDAADGRQRRRPAVAPRRGTYASRLPVRAAPEDPPRAAVELAGSQPLAGATVANLSPALAEELGTDRYLPRRRRARRRAGSPAQRIGLQPGDRILAVNGEDVIVQLRSAQAGRADAPSSGRSSSAAATSASTSSSAAELWPAKGQARIPSLFRSAGTAAARRPAAAEAA